MRRMGAVLMVMALLGTGCATTASLEDSTRRGLYLDAHPALSPVLRAAVEKGQVVTGMPREMVLASVGWPVRTESAASPTSIYDCWVYGDTRYDAVITYLYFKGDVLVGFDQKEVPTLMIAQSRLGV